MKRYFLGMIAAVTGMLASGSALAQLPTEPYLFGVWEGTMTIVPDRAEGSPPAVVGQGDQFPFRLNIRDTNLVMFFQVGPDEWRGIGENADLQLNRAGRSAVVIAAMSNGRDQDGNPITTETWMLNIVRWNEELITVHLSQVKSKDPASGAAPTSFAAVGQMKRISMGG